MKLSFLIQLALIVILIVGVYLLMNNAISGRSKMILIIFLIVIGIYLFRQLPFLKGYNEIIKNPESAKVTYDICNNKLKPSNGSISLSTWIYVDDWTYNYRSQKDIMKKGAGMPRIYLDAYKNDLKIEVTSYKKSENDFKSGLLDTLSDYNYGLASDKQIDLSEYTSDAIDCSNGKIYSSGGEDIDTSINNLNVSCSDYSSNSSIVTVNNIPLQKWVHILVAINSRSMDIYLNGKLVKTEAFEGVINFANINNGGITLCDNGGFGGFISKTQYYPYFVNPKKAWAIYKEGFGDAFASALDKYNLSVSFYEDSIEKKKYWVF